MYNIYIYYAVKKMDNDNHSPTSKWDSLGLSEPMLTIISVTSWRLVLLRSIRIHIYSMYIYIYVYIHIYIYTYVYVHIYTHIFQYIPRASKYLLAMLPLYLLFFHSHLNGAISLGSSTHFWTKPFPYQLYPQTLPKKHGSMSNFGKLWLNLMWF